MTGKRRTHENIEDFVRQNTRTIVKYSEQNPYPATVDHRMYKCKDCNKEYGSIQALGGHRASHRTQSSGASSTKKKKLYECKICKRGFEVVQALGGHMRTHRLEKIKNGDDDDDLKGESVSSSSSSCPSVIWSRKKVLKYDLNLTPHENEWIKLQVRLNQDGSSKHS